MNEHLRRNASLLVAVCLLITSLAGCGIGSQHLEMHYDDNKNENISDWDEIDNNNVDSWDSVDIVTWDEVDEYSNWVYSTLLFEDVAEECTIIECQVLDYSSNGSYFDGEKVYEMVNDKFDVNSFVAKYATGTGVIVVCVVINVVVSATNLPQTFVCFIAGAADAAVSYATKGAAFGAATKALSEALSTGGDIESMLYGALEGSADGYMWGAIYGAATGGFSSKYCFAGGTIVQTVNGPKAIQELSPGDLVYSYNMDSAEYSYQEITQVQKSSTTEIVSIKSENEIIEATPSHPFITDQGVVNAEDLKAGYRLLSTGDDYVIVQSVENVSYCEPIITYNLCIEKNHTYVVGTSGIVVHNRCNPNEKYADSTRKFEDGSDLAKKYPDGVYIKPNGYPDFSPYAQKIVKFDSPTPVGVDAGKCLRGDCYYDFKLANKAAGFGDSATATPKGWTWHHNEDGMTMELIPTDIHRAIGHDGGEKVIKSLLGLLG